MSDKERLEFLMEQAVCYIYVGDEPEARDLQSREAIDKAMKDQEADIG